MARASWLTLPLSLVAASAAPLLVISVDGLDHRYLRDADKLGLRIPNMRRVIAQGEWADGVMGVVPTVTWPSHTTLITGVPTERHGILNNRFVNGNEYPWSVKHLKARTLWQAAHEKGLKTAAITWPVTVDAPIDFNLPEIFVKRNGGGMDLASIEKAGTKGLVEKITRMFPSFPQEFMDDRTRTQAVVYLLKQERPDLILLHMVDHDAAAHDHGPFTREANAAVEYTDELIGLMLAAKPEDMVVALVSDHGFERIDAAVDPEGSPVRGGLLFAKDAAAAARWRADKRVREVPRGEVKKHLAAAPEFAAAFDTREHHEFAKQVREKGNHGLWPARPDYRSVFALWGPGVRAAKTPEISMLSIASRLAAILKVNL